MTTTDGRIYFDWAAGSAVRPSVAAALRDDLPEICLNPEAVHPAGRDAAALLQDCAARLSAAVTGSEAPVIWAASGSELFRLAAAAATISAPRTTAAATVFEHPAALAAWQNHPGGCIFCKPDELAQNCGNNTGFILVSHVQSVLGTIFQKN